MGQPANADYFRDAENAARVRAWQAAHPSYWEKRRKKTALVVLHEDCRAQAALERFKLNYSHSEQTSVWRRWL